MAIYRVPVRIEFANAGGPGFNIHHFSTQPGGQPGDLGEALDALTAYYTAIKGLFAGSTKITLGEGMIKDPLGAPEYVDDDARTVIGGSGGTGSTATPTMVALVVSWRTSSATRSGRGRSFLGPVGFATLAADGTPEPVILGTVRTASVAFVNDSRSANGWAHGVLSAKQGTFRETTGSTVRDRWSVLTSRRD